MAFFKKLTSFKPIFLLKTFIYLLKYNSIRGENISIRTKTIIISVILILFFTITSVSAQDNSTAEVDVLSAETDVPEPVRETGDTNTSIRPVETTVTKGDDFSVELLDETGKGISNRTVHFDFNNQKSDKTTDENGVAKLKIDLKAGKYTIKYSFNQTGYVPSSGETQIKVIDPQPSKIKGSDYVAYVGFKNTFKVTLTSSGKAVSGKTITFKVNGKTLTAKTNSKGTASVNLNLAKGKYTITYSYAGDDGFKKSSGKSKITVKKGMPVTVKKLSSYVFRNKKASYFKVKLVDARGNPVVSKKVTFKLNGKKYVKKTSKKGIASVKVKLKLGSYKIKMSFKKDSKYNKGSKTYKIKVKPRQARNNGMWLFGRDMKSVNLDKLQKYGFKQIFLNFKALEIHGKKAVEKWIKSAKSHGIKVHLWFQVFYNNGKWENPVKSGKVNHKMISSKVKLAKKYAKVKGVSGVHFDYVRYPGNAHQFKNSVKAVNTFVKKASKAVHKISKKLIVSAAVMPEPSSMKHYYAQDIPTMSKYLDVIVPMVYKGNYHAGDKWIKQVTKTFKKQSKKAKIWTGLQSYRSDAKLKKIPAKELMGDADAAALGGAYGVILFRFGLFNYINFKEV